MIGQIFFFLAVCFGVLGLAGFIMASGASRGVGADISGANRLMIVGLILSLLFFIIALVFNALEW